MNRRRACWVVLLSVLRLCPADLAFRPNGTAECSHEGIAIRAFAGGAKPMGDGAASSSCPGGAEEARI